MTNVNFGEYFWFLDSQNCNLVSSTKVSQETFEINERPDIKRNDFTKDNRS